MADYPEMRPRISKPLTDWLFTRRPVVWLLARLAHRADQLVWRLSKERTTLTSILTGLPVIRLTTTGAKSGAPCCVTLLTVVDGEKLVLMGTNLGQKHHPGWVYNLRAHPQAEVSWAGGEGKFTATRASGDEYERYWAQAVALYPGYANYMEMAAPRVPKIFILTPVKPDSLANS